MTDPAVYPSLLDGFDVDPTTFVERLTSDAVRRETWGDFATAQRLGVTGFPTLFLRDESTVYLVTKGYAPYEPIEDGIEAFLAEQYPDHAGQLTR